MALADILTMNSDDVADTKMALTRSLHVLSKASRDYAVAALGASNAVLEVAMDGGPVAAAYTNYAEIGELLNKSRRAVESTTDIMTVLLAANESDDDATNESYGQHLIEISKLPEVSAFIEASERRLTMINQALPSNPQPAARFNAAVFAPQEGTQGA